MNKKEIAKFAKTHMQPKSKLVKKAAKKLGVPVKKIKCSPLNPNGLKWIPTLKSDSKIVPPPALFLDEANNATPEQGKAFAAIQGADPWTALVEQVKLIAEMNNEIAMAMAMVTTWFDWMQYMETAHSGSEGWKLLKAALVAKPKVMTKKSERGLIAGFTPRWVESAVKAYNIGNNPNTHHLTDIISKIENK
jgi:hypothetical protein